MAEEIREPSPVEESGELRVPFRVGGRPAQRWPPSMPGFLLFIHVTRQFRFIKQNKKHTSCPAHMSGWLVRVFPTAPKEFSKHH